MPETSGDGLPAAPDVLPALLLSQDGAPFVPPEPGRAAEVRWSGDAQADQHQLRRLLRAWRNDHPGAHALDLSPDPDVLWDRVVLAIDAARQDGAGPLLPDVRLAVPMEP
jgi:phosphatidylserine/phosphatidylglycerophosphate/cardiolipin synthase-like enzyme